MIFYEGHFHAVIWDANHRQESENYTESGKRLRIGAGQLSFWIFD